MRDKLNNSPAAQVGVVIVLLVAAFVIFTQMSKGGEEAEEAGGAESAVGVEAETGVESEAPVTAVPTGGVAIPAPPLPSAVAKAYDADRTVVLLVVHDGGIDDRLVAQTTRRLASFPGTETFIVPARQIARYGAITLGVEVGRVPALIVVRPKSLSKGIPRASLSYGFQTAAAIDQAMRDATYTGPEVDYHPG